MIKIYKKHQQNIVEHAYKKTLGSQGCSTYNMSMPTQFLCQNNVIFSDLCNKNAEKLQKQFFLCGARGTSLFFFVFFKSIKLTDPTGRCNTPGGQKPSVATAIAKAIRKIFSTKPTHTEPIFSGPEGASKIVFPTESRRIKSQMNNTHPLGVDIGGKTAGVSGDQVVSPVDGTVTTAGIPDSSPSQSSYITIQGNDGRKYNILHSDNIQVQAGDKVKAGQHISDMGEVGSLGQVHTHFEVFEFNIRVDPLKLYPNEKFDYSNN